MKTWNGPTPYPDDIPERGIPGYALLGREGYREAMNSPVIVAMYEALGNMLPPWGSLAHEKQLAALAAYEAGMVEET